MTKRNIKYYEKHQVFTYGLEIKKVPNDIAEKLIREFNLNVVYARYHIDGTWYSLLKDYPAALFDMYGYVIIKSEDELKNGIIYTDRLNIPFGIHVLSGYIKYPSIPTSIENYEKQIKENEYRKEQEKIKLNEKTNKLRNIMLKSLNGESSLIRER